MVAPATWKGIVGELLKIVNPKRALVKEMNEKLVVVRKSLAEKRARLKAVVEAPSPKRYHVDLKKHNFY